MKTYTEEEIVAAFRNGWVKWDAEQGTVGEKLEKHILAELNRPKLHPDVPVLYENRVAKLGIILGVGRYTDEELEMDGPMENIRPLIPVEEVREFGDEELPRIYKDLLNALLDAYLENPHERDA